MIQKTLDELAVRTLNRALDDAPEAKQRLQRYAGHSAQFDFSPVKLTVAVLPDGRLAAASIAQPDVTLKGSLGSAIRMAATGPAAAMNEIEIAGNAGLAQEIAFLAAHLKLDIEGVAADRARALLPPRLADAVTHEGFKAARGLFQWAGDAGQRLAKANAEYLTEEANVLIGRAQFDALDHDIAQLQQRLDRLAARLKLIEQRNEQRKPSA